MYTLDSTGSPCTCKRSEYHRALHVVLKMPLLHCLFFSGALSQVYMDFVRSLLGNELPLESLGRQGTLASLLLAIALRASILVTQYHADPAPLRGGDVNSLGGRRRRICLLTTL